GEMVVGGCQRDRALRFAEVRRDAPPAPGPAEVQAVEMGDLAVASVADDGGLKEGRRFSRLDPRQELLEPEREKRAVRPRHAQGFAKRRGKEFVAARLPGLAVAVAGEPVARAVPDLL